MINVGIAGVTGYAGIELVRILLNHSQVQITYAGTKSHVGALLKNVYPHLPARLNLECSALEVDDIVQKCDLLFTALPHGHAIGMAPALLDSGKKMIDLGADFRLKNPHSYEKWYEHPPASEELLAKAVYGLPELTMRDRIRQARLIANPGCYPTCSVLGCLPAIKAGIVDVDSIILDAKSGVSGAGRAMSLHAHFSEVSENFKAYGIGGAHRHNPEIEQALTQIAGRAATVQFTPHLLPMVRGLLVTAYLPLLEKLSTQEVWDLYADTYKDEPFIRLHPLGEFPQTANVKGSNYCDIGLAVDSRTERLIVISCIDNLVKGAAGQAVQNMNLMYGLEESMGLDHLYPLYP